MRSKGAMRQSREAILRKVGGTRGSAEALFMDSSRPLGKRKWQTWRQPAHPSSWESAEGMMMTPESLPGPAGPMGARHILVCPCHEVLVTGSELPLCLSSPSTWGAGASLAALEPGPAPDAHWGPDDAPHTYQMRHRYSGPLFIVLYEIFWGGGWGQFRKRDGDLVIMIHVWIQLFQVFFFFLIFWPSGILVP